MPRVNEQKKKQLESGRVSGEYFELGVSHGNTETLKDPHPLRGGASRGGEGGRGGGRAVKWWQSTQTTISPS